jgi:hypothetical protein
VELDLASQSGLGEPTEWSGEDWGPLWGEGVPGALSATEVEARIHALMLRFHGHEPTSAEDARVAYWRWLFETTSFVSDAPETPWVALCVAMITHPDFYSY